MFEKIFRRVVKVLFVLPALGILKIPLFGRYRRFLLSTWYTPDRRGRLDNLLYPAVYYLWLRLEYWPEKDPDIRETKKELLMGGDSGREWAKYYDFQPLDFSAKVGKMTLWDASPVYSTLERILRESIAEQSCCVIQVGSSSGREIAWVARNFPNTKCIGTDIYPEVIEYSSQSHNAPNLEFEQLAAKNVSELISQLRDYRLIIFSSGSLQYVQPEHLGIFFKALSMCPNIDVVVCEPASIVHGEPTNLAGYLLRGDFSYTHNYKQYAEESGLCTLECRIIYPYYPHDPKHGKTVHYFWWGRGCAHKSEICETY